MIKSHRVSRELMQDQEREEMIDRFMINYFDVDQKILKELEQVTFRGKLVDKRDYDHFVDIHIWESILSLMNVKTSAAEKYVLAIDTFAG